MHYSNLFSFFLSFSGSWLKIPRWSAMVFTERARVVLEVRYLEYASSVRVIQELLPEGRVSLSQSPVDDYQCLQCNLHCKEGTDFKPLGSWKNIEKCPKFSLEVESFYHSEHKFTQYPDFLVLYMYISLPRNQYRSVCVYIYVRITYSRIWNSMENGDF